MRAQVHSINIYTIPGDHTPGLFHSYKLPMCNEFYREGVYTTIAFPEDDVDYNNDELYSFIDKAVLCVNSHVEASNYNSFAYGRIERTSNYAHYSYGMCLTLSVRKWYRSLSMENLNFYLRVPGYHSIGFQIKGCPLEKAEEFYNQVVLNLNNNITKFRYLFRYNPLLTVDENINYLLSGRECALPENKD